MHIAHVIIRAQDQNLLMKSKRFGAHVLAPCAHDGGCPMAGQRTWCHFEQRYQHPGFMQVGFVGTRAKS